MKYKIAKSEMTTFLKNANMSDFDVNSFMEQYNPTIGIAFSGGGYRAMLSGAGNMKALDSEPRTFCSWWYLTKCKLYGWFIRWCLAYW